MILYF